MPEAAFKGMTTKFVYRFIYGQGATGSIALPAAVADAFGNPTTLKATYNGETVIPVNRDGSVAQSVIGGPPAGDPYSFTKLPSLWESNT